MKFNSGIGKILHLEDMLVLIRKAKKSFIFSKNSPCERESLLAMILQKINKTL